MTKKANDNTALWDALYRTDPAHTKQFTRAGGFRGTAIAPMWGVKRATETFGPIGKGWGWNVMDQTVIEDTVFILVSVWYVLDGTRYETGAQYGGETFKRKDGKMDDEAFKKATTDGVMKCLSYLGIGADVHMGQFDDSKYVAAVEASYKQQAASTGTDDTAELIAAINQCDDIEMLKGLRPQIDEHKVRYASSNGALVQKVSTAAKQKYAELGGTAAAA